MSKRKDLTGLRFNKLVVLEFSHSKNHKSYWKCKCDCGNYHLVRSDSLTSGNVGSCGCWNSECRIKEDGKSKSKLYHLYHGILQRCYNLNTSKYSDYGGRGITVCDIWKNNYDEFLKWSLENGYVEGLSIDRIDVNGNYEPNNCRWVTQKVQCSNMRRNRNITYNNETHNISEWSKIFNINRNTLNYRLNNNWDLDKAFNQI